MQIEKGIEMEEIALSLLKVLGEEVTKEIIKEITKRTFESLQKRKKKQEK